MKRGAPIFLNLALKFLSYPILSHKFGIAPSSYVDVQSIGKLFCLIYK